MLNTKQLTNIMTRIKKSKVKDMKEGEIVDGVILLDGIKRLLSDTNLKKCIFSGKYLYLDNNQDNAVQYMCDILQTNIPKNSFDYNDERTYRRFTASFAFSLIDDFEEFDSNPDNYIIVSTIVLGRRRRVYNTKEHLNELIKKYDLIKGINSEDVYYLKEELKVMDRPEPYRKFDFTFSKINNSTFFSKKLTSKELQDVDVKDTIKNILKRNISMGVDSLTFKELEGLKYTFGIELETCVGRFEDDEVSHLNLKAVHDGSLREEDGSSPIGGEYVTGVLKGDAGLSQLHEICRVLQTKCQVDRRCGVHAHIGSLNWNKEEIVYSYILAQILEKEIFDTLPISRRKNEYCRSISKLFSTVNINSLSSCKSAEDYDILINEYYNLIFTEVSGLPPSIKSSREYNKNTNHPKGSKCSYDKKSQRYSWLNYVTLLFNTKETHNSYTLEFRPMSGALNYTKVKNWLKLCMAFCNFVENNKSLIKNNNNVPITLETIINKAYPKTGAKLLSYINGRKEIFKTEGETIDHVVDNKISRKSIKEVACAC